MPSANIDNWKKQQNFRQTCEKQYNGVADGARCFFIPDVPPTNWENARAVCENQSATLATIVTGSEKSKIKNFFQVRNDKAKIFLKLCCFRPSMGINTFGLQAKECRRF